MVERIRAIGTDPTLVAQTVAAAGAEVEAQAAERQRDLGRLGTEAASLRREHEALVQAVAQGGPASLVARVAVAEGPHRQPTRA